MNIRYLAGFVAAIIGVATFAAAPARAGLLVSIDPVIANSPSTNNALEILLTNDGAPITIGTFGFVISTTNLDITFTGADFSTTNPYIFAGDSFDQFLAINLNTFGAGQSMDGSDLSFSGAGTVIGTNQTLALGRVLFDIANNATPGSFAVTFESGTSLSDGVNPIPIDTIRNGQITIAGSTAAPEPATAALFGLALIGLVWKKRGSGPKG